MVAGGWTLIILLLSALPSSSLKLPTGSNIPHLDKIAHLVMYFIFTFLWARVLETHYEKRKIVLYSLIGCFLYGLLLEILQKMFFTTRDFELLDILSNIGGGIAGIAVFLSLDVSFYPFRIKRRG